MSALVGYDSSSDESDTNPTRQGVNGRKIEEAKGEADPAIPQSTIPPIRDTPIQGPAVGPSSTAFEDFGNNNGIEAGVDQSSDQDPDNTPMSPYSAERDALRSLTQTAFMSNSIPPSPPGSPDPVASAKFARFLELKSKGVHFNEDLANKSSFQNPSLLSNMLARAGISEQEQYSNSLPQDVSDSSVFPDWAYKEGLIQQQREVNQKAEADKKALSVTGKRTIDWVGETHSGASSKSSTPSRFDRSEQEPHSALSKRKRP